MPLELLDKTATLTGVVTIDDVEPLVAWLRGTPEAEIDVRNCNHLHTGVIQAILMFRPKVTSAPQGSTLSARVLPLLTGGDGAPAHAEDKPP